MPSQTSWPGTESQKSDGSDRRWVGRVDARTQDKCYPIHVLPSLLNRRAPDQDFKRELWWSGHSLHRRGWRANRSITLQVVMGGIFSSLCYVKKGLCTLFYGHIHLSVLLRKQRALRIYIFNGRSYRQSQWGFYDITDLETARGLFILFMPIHCMWF